MVTKTTRLAAVNEMLGFIGESPANSLTGTLGHDTAIALSTLEAVSRTLQLEGWHWNTFEEMSYSPSIPDGFVQLPSNVMRADGSVGFHEDMDLILIAGRMYDKEANSDVFTSALTLDILKVFEFEEIPESARRYVVFAAARQFAEKATADSQLVESLRTMMYEAKTVLKLEETRTSGASIWGGGVARKAVDRYGPLDTGLF